MKRRVDLLHLNLGGEPCSQQHCRGCNMQPGNLSHTVYPARAYMNLKLHRCPPLARWPWVSFHMSLQPGYMSQIIARGLTVTGLTARTRCELAQSIEATVPRNGYTQRMLTRNKCTGEPQKIRIHQIHHSLDCRTANQVGRKNDVMFLQ